MEILTNTVFRKDDWSKPDRDDFYTSVAIFIPYGNNRDIRLIEYCKKVWNFYNISVNFIECPFPLVSHGSCLNQIIKEVFNSGLSEYIDEFILTENDSIPLTKDILNIVHDFIKNKKTLFGIVQNSGHKYNPNGTIYHNYVGPAFAAFSKKLYQKLTPDFDHLIDRSDTLEEFSYRVKETGNIISLIYPSEVELRNCELDVGSFGMGNTYSDLIYHAAQCDNPESTELFIKKCKEIIGEL